MTSPLQHDIIMQSTARTGKSYQLVRNVCEHRVDEKVMYISSAHSEARAQVDKFREFGQEVVYLVGEQRARQQYDVSTSGPVPNNYRPHTPEEASMRDDVNAYQCLVAAAKEADVVVTVPELIDKIGDRDLLVMTEEAAYSRMMSESFTVMNIERVNGYDRSINGSFKEHEDRCQKVIDEIDDLDQQDYIHNVIRTAARVVVDIGNIIEDWIPRNWEEADAQWDELQRSVERRLEDMAFERMPSFDELYQRLQNYNRVDKLLLNIIYWDGFHEYENGNKKRLFLIGDTDRLFVPLPDDLTTWLAGNNMSSMKEFQHLVDGNLPEERNIIKFEGGFTPVQDCIRVVRYSGGDNRNQQSRHVQEIIEEVQNVRDKVGTLVVSGSSHHTARHAEKIRMCTTPARDDDLESLEMMADAGMAVAIPENSSFSEGVDTPFFRMGALYNGQFATPREDYIGEHGWELDENPELLKRQELTRAAQNAILRVSNVPDGNGGVEGTGKTPVIVPDGHVPDFVWQLFEEYGIKVYETDDPTEARRFVVHTLDMDAKEHDGRIVDEEDAPTETQAFDRLRQSMGRGSTGVDSIADD